MTNPVDISEEAVRAYAEKLNDETEAFIDLGRYSTMLLALRKALTKAEGKLDREISASIKSHGEYQTFIASLRAALVEAARRLAKDRHLWNGPCHECAGVLDALLKSTEPK